MSDNAQLARTGTAGALVIGTTVVTGWWLLAIALTIVIIGAVVIRMSFRPRLAAGQSTVTADVAEGQGDTEPGAGL
ncbi:hypothetical protein ACPXCS_06110 [Streptomyces sp. DT190]|uniref:hypothetical protein n=1 Tax=unclassified Streptomyces TaxID=2593676 RepID=UPI003CED9C26